MDYKRDVKSIRLKASGKWGAIFSALAPNMVDAFNAPNRGFPCPVCGGDDRFRFDRKKLNDGAGFCRQCDKYHDGVAIVQAYHPNDSFPWILKLIDDCISTESSYRANNQNNQNKPKERDFSGSIRFASAVLRQSTKNPTDSAIRYYERRGLLGIERMPIASIKYSKGVAVQDKGDYLLKADGKSWLTYPAIIGIMSTHSGIKGIQIIRLTSEGEKASKSINEQFKLQYRKELQYPEKPFVPVNHMEGSAIRFGHAEKTYHVGEGVETMLAVSLELNTTSVAAACTAYYLEKIDIPSHVKELVIWCDKDNNQQGIASAMKLRKRYMEQGGDVKIMLPSRDVPKDKKGIDWLDCKTDIKSSY